MNLRIKVSSVFILIVTQTILSIFFYIGDSYVSASDAIWVLILSIPLTIFIEWVRTKISSTDQDKS